MGRSNYVDQGILNLPLSSGVLAARIGVQYSQQSGYIDAEHPDALGQVTRRDLNDDRATVVRATLKYQSPDSDLTILPAVLVQRETFGGLPQYDPATPLETPLYVTPRSFDNSLIASLTIQKSLFGASLTSASSYFQRKSNLAQDGDDQSRSAADSQHALLAHRVPTYPTIYTNIPRSCAWPRSRCRSPACPSPGWRESMCPHRMTTPIPTCTPWAAPRATTRRWWIPATARSEPAADLHSGKRSVFPVHTLRGTAILAVRRVQLFCPSAPDGHGRVARVASPLRQQLDRVCRRLLSMVWQQRWHGGGAGKCQGTCRHAEVRAAL